MKYYLLIQYKRIFRGLTEFGINPYLAYLIFAGLFIILSNFIFQKFIYSDYIYLCLYSMVLNSFGKKNRNEFLKNCYLDNSYRLIRFFENVIISVPFFLFLLFEKLYLQSSIILILALLFSFLNRISVTNYAIPTPFMKYPYEFIIGFRKTYWMFFICYSLLIISINYENLNLGFFSLGITFLTCVNYYSKQEPKFYIWVFSMNPKKFLLTKIKIAILYSAFLYLPILLALLFFFPKNADLILLLTSIGIIFLIANILGKYSNYPSKININNAFLLIFCLFLPFVLIIIIPYYYKLSMNKLKSILNDSNSQS